ncbi:putative nucleic acid-binding protein [Paenibacillus xylanexedens]|uniref:PIN domain-containing protein n=1 Tax=Paenibacillus xylanexedens TaxID=528191 RepID=UPI00209D7312|nr:PIN domain-containing protein [Paenibacillus xylanexedens]MCP1425450.1 putative nucleic acid-binding protein [Paenibacillus xylanexedens]
MSTEKEKINYFAHEDVYPDTDILFQFKTKSSNEIKDTCLIVLDTNVLLLPYTVGSKSLDEIRNTFNKLITQSRLFVPAQVVREFVKNRPNKLSELFQQISDIKSKATKLNTPRYPLFESLPEYNVALKKQEEINKLITEYHIELSKVLEYIRGLNWDDHVSDLYKQLFTSKQVVQLNTSREDCIKEFEYKSQCNIPPGFKDKAKPDGGIGDFLIWKTILQLGLVHKKDLIFVTGDEKNDWYHQSMKQPLYPRYELIDEYRRVTNGATIRFVSFSGLLTILGASENVIEEVQTIESEPKIQSKDKIVKIKTHSRLRSNILKHVALEKANGHCQVCGINYPHLEISHIKPLSLGGEDLIDNIIVVCPNCHRISDYKKKLEEE